MKTLMYSIGIALSAGMAACTSVTELQLGSAVPSGQFAFNTGTSFYWCNPQTLAPCVEAWTPFTPAMLRFPGGIDANYYHIDGPGYGYKRPPLGGSDPQTQGVGSQDDETITRAGDGSSDEEYSVRRDGSSDDTYRSTNGKDNEGKYVYPRDAAYPGGKNVIGAFIQLAVGSRSPLLFTCNMLDATYEDNKLVLDSLLRGGVSLAGIELGNEFYLPRYRDKYPNVQAYIDTAKYYAARLQQDFPGVKIGAVASPSEIMPAHEKQYAYYKRWNQALAAEDFYDAYIVHYYIKDANTWCPGDSIVSAELPATFARYQDSLQKHLDYWFGPALDGFKAIFPGKKMWLTEWSTTNRYTCFGNTQVNNLFFAQYQNELATRYSDLVEFAVHHNWLGRGKHFPMLAPAGKDFAERSSSPLFKLLQPIFSGRETRVAALPVSITGNLPSGVKLYAYHQQATGSEPARLLVVVINLNEQAQTVRLDGGQVKTGSQVFDLQTGKVKSVFAAKPWASLGSPGFFSDTAVAPEGIQTAEGAFSGQFTAPGYGVSVAELKQ